MNQCIVVSRVLNSRPYFVTLPDALCIFICICIISTMCSSMEAGLEFLTIISFKVINSIILEHILLTQFYRISCGPGVDMFYIYSQQENRV